MTAGRASKFSRESSLGYQVNHLGRLLAQALHRRISPMGVVPGQFPPLLALFERDDLTQSELCVILKIEQPTMANTLRRMQRDSLIHREPDPGDGRRTRVTLTPRARSLHTPLTAAARQVNGLATRGLTDLEVEAFMDTMARIIANLDVDDDSAAGAQSDQEGRSGGPDE